MVSLGERTPVGIRMTAPPASLPETWKFCGLARQFSAAVVGDDGTLDQLDVRRVFERTDGQAFDDEW